MIVTLCVSIVGSIAGYKKAKAKKLKKINPLYQRHDQSQQAQLSPNPKTLNINNDIATDLSKPTDHNIAALQNTNITITASHVQTRSTSGSVNDIMLTFDGDSGSLMSARASQHLVLILILYLNKTKE